MVRRRRDEAPPEAESAQEARTRAQAISLRLLTHRARSVSEVRERLSARGLAEDVVEAEVARLLDLGLLDDAAFAREKAASLVRRGVGPKGLRARLFAGGVGEEAAGAAAEALEAAGGETEVARALVARRFGDLAEADRATRAKAAAFLARRGFSGSVAGAVCGIFEDGTD